MSSQLNFQGFKVKIALEISKKFKYSNLQRTAEYVLLIYVKCVNQSIGKYYFLNLT
jgi:hypothetical protein